MTPASFHLLDLPSQAAAVGRILAGLSEAEKLAWIGERGELCAIDARGLEDRRVYSFESALGLRCAFMIVGDDFAFFGDDFAFFGDNTTYVVRSWKIVVTGAGDRATWTWESSAGLGVGPGRLGCGD